MRQQEISKHAYQTLFAKLVVPPLTTSLYKGQAGRIGIIGGCAEYTGAPFFAGMAALRAGADMAQIFCAAEAALAIKAQSPDLIVLGCMPGSGSASQSEAIEIVSRWLPRLGALVVGPGLGRHPDMLKAAEKIVETALGQAIPVILDGDALSTFACERLEALAQTAAASQALLALTPNRAEMQRLKDAHGADSKPLDQLYPHLLFVQKGGIDHLRLQNAAIQCDTPGSPRRCGGQGDLLAGTLGTFLAWARHSPSPCPPLATTLDSASSKYLLAAHAACTVVRSTSHRSYSKLGRSMLASDMLLEFPMSISNITQDDSSK